jgi:scyllo-inositol 2-dehydrogenase (NADP+)
VAVSPEQRVALAGYGLAGEFFHAPLIAATRGLRLASVVTSNEERAERARAAHPDAVVLPDVEELWRRAGDHDLVVIAAANRAHVPVAMSALEAGLPVVVDKPLAATAEDGRRLAEAAEARSLMLAVFHNRRWDGDMLTVQRLLREGRLGDVHRFESRFERWRPEVRAGTWRERPSAEEAGGVLYDLGTHLIDQALVLFGEPEHVYGELDRRRPGAEVDDDAFVAITHRSGVRSHLWMSQAAAHGGPRMRVLGSEAAYVKSGLDVQEEQLRAGSRPGDPGFAEEPAEAWGVLGAGDEWAPVRTEPGEWAAFYRGVDDALREGGPPPVGARDAIRVLEVIEEVCSPTA